MFENTDLGEYLLQCMLLTICYHVTMLLFLLFLSHTHSCCEINKTITDNLELNSAICVPAGCCWCCSAQRATACGHGFIRASAAHPPACSSSKQQTGTTSSLEKTGRLNTALCPSDKNTFFVCSCHVETLVEERRLACEQYQ